MRRFAYRVARLWFKGYFYPNTLRGRRPAALTYVPPENWPGNANRGQAILDGHFRFLNYRVRTQDVLSGGALPGEAWMAVYHSFGWLRDLCAIRNEAAAVEARRITSAWIGRNSRWHPLSWHPDILSTRICSWLTYADTLGPGSDDAFIESFLDNLARQVRHLRREARFVDHGPIRLSVLKALIYAALSLPGGRGHVPGLVRQLIDTTERQFLPDGGHVTRSPAVQLEAVRQLVDTRRALEGAEIAFPKDLTAHIERVATMGRFFLHSDKHLALFNGADEGDAALADLVLKVAGAAQALPNSAPQTGFERVGAGETLLIIDAGSPLEGMPGQHAGTLSFEMSYARHRVVVNCGALGGSDETWRQVQRSTAAHSTLTVEDRNSSVLRPDGTLEQVPRKVGCQRIETDGRTLIDLSHDGYLASHGLTHRRRIFIDVSGTDIRGEDTLLGVGEHRFTIRFHLHYTVKASLVRGGTSVLLWLLDGTGWRMRCEGGIIGLQESVYLGRIDGARRSEQIVISGGTRAGSSVVRWAFSKLDSRPPRRKRQR